MEDSFIGKGGSALAMTSVMVEAVFLWLALDLHLACHHQNWWTGQHTLVPVGSHAIVLLVDHVGWVLQSWLDLETVGVELMLEMKDYVLDYGLKGMMNQKWVMEVSGNEILVCNWTDWMRE